MTHAHLQSLTPNASFYFLRYVRSLDMNGDPVQEFDQAQSKSGVDDPKHFTKVVSSRSDCHWHFSTLRFVLAMVKFPPT